jgi:diguanylate cyclase (GGDEF)-like protein
MTIVSGRSRDSGTRKKPLLSIRARLTLLAMLAVVPLLFDRVRMLEVRRAERTEIAASEALDLARRGADAQRQVITTVRAVMQVMARTYVAAAPQGEACKSYLDDVMTGVPWLKGISILAPNGRIECSTTAGASGLNLSDRPYIRDAIAKHEFVLSNYLIGRMHSAPTVVAALPIIDAGAVRGIVLASINLEWLGHRSHSISTRSDASVLLVDGHGTILAGHPGMDQWIGKGAAGQPLVQAMLAQPEGSVVTAGLDGVRRIFAFVNIPWTNAHFAVGLDEATILTRVNSQIAVAYLQLAFFALLALFVAWIAGDRLIVEPLRRMAKKVAMFGRGHLEVRPEPTAWVSEFVPLVNAFNDMASRLEERERELKSKNDHLSELASLDGLSGLANRRSFDARLETEWQRAHETGEPLALLMIDVDRFKLFNDHYGHVEGDMCLRRIGQTLSTATHEPNFAARYGGEEFTVLLRNTDARQATTIAENLRHAVEDLNIAHAAAPRRKMTLSIGVAGMASAETSPALVQAADAALYAAKRNGRNAVACCPDAVRPRTCVPFAKAS